MNVTIFLILFCVYIRIWNILSITSIMVLVWCRLVFIELVYLLILKVIIIINRMLLLRLLSALCLYLFYSHLRQSSLLNLRIRVLNYFLNNLLIIWQGFYIINIWSKLWIHIIWLWNDWFWTNNRIFFLLTIVYILIIKE